MVRVVARLLVAEHIQYFGVVAGFNKAIAAVGFNLKLNAFASGVVFHCKVLLDLAKCQP